MRTRAAKAVARRRRTRIRKTFCASIRCSTRRAGWPAITSRGRTSFAYGWRVNNSYSKPRMLQGSSNGSRVCNPRQTLRLILMSDRCRGARSFLDDGGAEGLLCQPRAKLSLNHPPNLHSLSVWIHSFPYLVISCWMLDGDLIIPSHVSLCIECNRFPTLFLSRCPAIHDPDSLHLPTVSI